MEETQIPNTDARMKRCKTCKSVYPDIPQYYGIIVKYQKEDGSVTTHSHPSCVTCRREADAVVYKLRKTAPPAPDNCQCCGKHKSETKINKLVLDHCHSTGTFRGWLCDTCNRGIGNLGDDLTGVLMAVEYLKKVTNSEED
jgi:hypothetical protein